MQTNLFATQSQPITETSKVFPTLYRIDSNGKLRQWKIEVNKFENHFVVRTESGMIEGVKTSSLYDVIEGKNIGRSNQTTPFEQACFEAQSKWDAQIRSGYVENPAEAKQDVLGSGIPAPMLAQKYSPNGTLSGSKSLAKMKIEGEEIYVQPKLDGIRCLAKVSSDGVELYTRKGDRMLPIPHIEQQLKESFDIWFEDEIFILDGELYTDKMTFNALNGLLRREEKTPEHLEQLKQVSYNLYDAQSELTYEKRWEMIRDYFSHSENVLLVDAARISASDVKIREYMETYLNQGFEGLMIRRLDMPYENKRSWGLCKYKDFQDAEYKVVDIIEDVRGGIIGAFECEIFVNGNRQTFRAGIKDLTQDEARKMLANKHDYIGRMATVEFFSLSEYGVPRFPKLKGFRSDV